MSKLSRAGEGGLLVQLLDEAYQRRSWHGTNLRGSIRGVSAEQAAWRPHQARYSIAEIVVHCAYWKYAVRRRLRGDKRGSFALKGSNWFSLPAPLTETAWREYVARLDAEHRALREAVAALGDALPDKPIRGSKMPAAALIRGVALHDVYHAGQIQLMKGMRKRDLSTD